MPIEITDTPDPFTFDLLPGSEFDAEGLLHTDMEDLAEQPFHRPPPFSLSHGEGGAKIAYGQFMYNINEMYFGWNAPSVGDPFLNTVSQGNITGLDAKIPTIGDASGAAMDATVEDGYHQLDSYGDVYLVWKFDPQQSDANGFVPECWVQVGLPTNLNTVTVLSTNLLTPFYERPETVSGTLDIQARYAVKIGTVNEGSPIQQNLASDMYWCVVIVGPDCSVI